MALIARNPEKDSIDHIAYEVFAPFLPHLLDAEIAAEHGWPKADIAFEGDPSKASAEEPVTIWVSSEVNTKAMDKVLRDHIPEEPPVQNMPQHIADIKAKLDADEELEHHEIKAILKHLLDRIR